MNTFNKKIFYSFFFFSLLLENSVTESSPLAPCQLKFQSGFNPMLEEWSNTVQKNNLNSIDYWSTLFYPTFYRVSQNEMKAVVNAWKSERNDIESNQAANEYFFFQFLTQIYQYGWSTNEASSNKYQALIKTLETMILTMSVQYPDYVHALIPQDVLSPNTRESSWQRQGTVFLLGLRARAAVGDELAINKLIAILKGEFEENLYPIWAKEDFFDGIDSAQIPNIIKKYKTAALEGLISVRDVPALKSIVLPSLIETMKNLPNNSIHSNKDPFIFILHRFVYLSIIAEDSYWLNYVFGDQWPQERLNIRPTWLLSGEKEEAHHIDSANTLRKVILLALEEKAESKNSFLKKLFNRVGDKPSLAEFCQSLGQEYGNNLSERPECNLN